MTGGVSNKIMEILIINHQNRNWVDTTQASEKL